MDFTQLKEWVRESWKAQGEWREQAADDFAFDAGHQWTEAEESDLEERGRLAVVFNRTAVIIGSVAGSEINNRTEVQFIPREIGDVKPNEVLTAGGMWFRDQSDAEDAESEAFQHLLICGLGVTDTGLDWEADPDGQPSIEAIDPLEFGWDHHAYKKGLIDARYFFRVRKMPREDAQDRFPSFDPAQIHADWLPDFIGTKGVNAVGDEYATEDQKEVDDRKTFTVVQMQYRSRERSVQMENPQTGEPVEMGEREYAALVKKAEEAGFPISAMPSRRITKWVWKQAFLGQGQVLEENQPDPERSTFNVMTGHWDRKDKQFYGLLRSMRDPQKYANKWLSETLHIIGANSKGGVMAETGAVEDIRDFEESWAAADSVSWLKPGGLAKIQEKSTAQMPVALMQLTEFAIQSIRDVSGVNMELLGLRDANQPGVLEYQRRQSAMTTMARFFDALRFYRKRQGHSILNFLRNYIAPQGRLVRLVKEDQEQYVPLAVDEGTAKYDVVVDDAPSAPNEREKAWAVIEAMMPLLQGANLDLGDWADILEYSPLPSSFAQKVREKAKAQQSQGPDPMQQLELQKLQSETAENMASAQLDQARTAQIAAETQLAPIGSMADLMRAQPAPQGAT